MKTYFGHFVGTSRRFCAEQQGATGTEYAIILTLIVVALVGAAALFGLTFSGTTTSVYSNLSGGTESGGGSFGPGSLRNNTTVKVP